LQLQTQKIYRAK